MIGMRKTAWMGGAACGLAMLVIGCSGAGGNGQDESAMEVSRAEAARMQEAALRIDAANAVRLRQLADATVTTAVRAFGPGDGLPLDELGARLYRTRGCIVCHGPGARNPIGPDLTEAFGTMRAVEGRGPVLMDLDYINVALMRPDALVAKGYPAGEMPSFEGALYPREVLAITMYLQSLAPVPTLEPEVQQVPEVAAEVQPTVPDKPVERVRSPLVPEVIDTPREPEAAPPSERTDGRPDWWFEGLRRHDGRVWTCVETLGTTFSEARTAAVLRGQDLLAERMGLRAGEALDDPRVQYIWVTPLPSRGGASRYAAYAMISAIIDSE